MSKAEFTRGPWRIIEDDTGDRPVSVPSIQAPPELDCGIVHWDGFWQEHWQSARGQREMWANAHLIAAAPELYEALRRLRGQAWLNIETNQGHAEIAALVDGVLAKARGEKA